MLLGTVAARSTCRNKPLADHKGFDIRSQLQCPVFSSPNGRFYSKKKLK